jgi:hypothetical protein
MKHRTLFHHALAGLFLLSSFSVALAEGGNKSTTIATPLTTLTFHADLDAAAALPGNSEAASGEVVGTYDKSTHVLKFYAHFVGLSSPVTNARFHGPAAFDRTASATVAAPRPDARLVEGTAWLDPEQEQDLLEGRWYLTSQQRSIQPVKFAAWFICSHWRRRDALLSPYVPHDTLNPAFHPSRRRL